MSTITTHVLPAGFNWFGMNKHYVIEGILDLTSGAVTENNDYTLITLPVNCLVLGCAVEILTAAVGTTCTIDVGYGGNGSGTVDDFGADIDGKGTAGTTTWTASATADGTFFSAADTIDVNFDVATSITAGPKLAVRAVIVDLS